MAGLLTVSGDNFEALGQLLAAQDTDPSMRQLLRSMRVAVDAPRMRMHRAMGPPGAVVSDAESSNSNQDGAWTEPSSLRKGGTSGVIVVFVINNRASQVAVDIAGSIAR